MRKIVKFKNTTKTEYVEKGGVKYKVVDLGGMKMMVRVRDDKEIKRDAELFKLSKYYSFKLLLHCLTWKYSFKVMADILYIFNIVF